jgi:predicted AAA+ superfamily ATPase
MIKRFKINEIGDLLKQFPVVAIIGPRQCGKTTLTKMEVLKLKKTGLYFDLESPKDASKFHDAEFFLESISSDVECIVIDEVQRMPELFSILRSLIDQNKQKGKYVLLGSASPELVKGVSESLAGRIAYCEISPFNITEINKNKEDLNKLWFRGGFPDAFLCETDEDWFRWMDNFFRTFIERDLNTLFGVTFSPSLMYKLWRMLAHNHGQILNSQSLAKGLDVSPTTVNRYIDFLEGAFMVRKLPAYFTNAKKRLIKSPKIYIRDSGLVNYLLDITKEKDIHFHSNVGNCWEGYALEQILQHLPNYIKPFYYRTHDGSEMDLVLVRGITSIACIELKTTNNPSLTRGFYESIKDLKCDRNFVVTPFQEVSYKINENTLVCGLIDFITNDLKKLITI